MVGVGGESRDVWREDLSLFEKPFDAMFLLGRGKVERSCEGVLMLSFLTEKTASMRTAKGVATMSRRRGFQAGWLLWGV